MACHYTVIWPLFSWAPLRITKPSTLIRSVVRCQAKQLSSPAIVVPQTTSRTSTSVFLQQTPLSTHTELAMSFQRVGLRFAQQMRAFAPRQTLRSSLQQRFASTHPTTPGQAGSKLVGAQDNAFNRERAAVKAHAAATSGESRFGTETLGPRLIV